MSSKRWECEKRLANSLVRFSLGRESTVEEVEFVERVLPEVIHARAQPADQ